MARYRILHDNVSQFSKGNVVDASEMKNFTGHPFDLKHLLNAQAIEETTDAATHTPPPPGPENPGEAPPVSTGGTSEVKTPVGGTGTKVVDGGKK